MKCGFSIGYFISRKYLPIWVSVSVSDLNQNSGLGCTLLYTNTSQYQWRCHSIAGFACLKFKAVAMLCALTNLLLIDQSQIDFRCPALFRQRPSSLHFFTKIHFKSDLVLWYFFWHFASWGQNYPRFRNRHVGQWIYVGPGKFVKKINIGSWISTYILHKWYFVTKIALTYCEKKLF